MDFKPGTNTLFASLNTSGEGVGGNNLAIIDTITNVGDVIDIGPSVSGLDALAWQPPLLP
jgi:hypothetical protein